MCENYQFLAQQADTTFTHVKPLSKPDWYLNFMNTTLINQSDTCFWNVLNLIFKLPTCTWEEKSTLAEHIFRKFNTCIPHTSGHLDSVGYH